MWNRSVRRGDARRRTELCQNQVENGVIVAGVMAILAMRRVQVLRENNAGVDVHAALMPMVVEMDMHAHGRRVRAQMSMHARDCRPGELERHDEHEN